MRWQGLVVLEVVEVVDVEWDSKPSHRRLV